MEDKIVELIDILKAVKASSPDAEEIVVYGTEEYINKIKDYIPSDVSVKIFPAEYFPEARKELVYIVPINGIKPIKVAFEDIDEYEDIDEFEDIDEYEDDDLRDTIKKILEFIEDNRPTEISTDWERGCAYALDEIEKLINENE